MTLPRLALTGALTLGFAAAAIAAGHDSVPREIGARNGLMHVVSINTSVVGNMVRGRADYDAEAAQAAADSLAGIAMVDLSTLWVEGTSSEDVESSRALPTIWSDRAGYEAAWDEFGTAAAALQDVAGTGLEALQPAVGALGRTCGGCHDDYRKPED